MPHIPAILIPFLLIAVFVGGGFYAGALFERTRTRPVPIILLAVLLVAVSLYAGVAVGGWLARMRADSLAHNSLRNLQMMLDVLPPVIDAEGKQRHIWPTSLKLPLGIYALYDREDEIIRRGQTSPVPIACISPGYDPDVFMVLFSDGNRQKLSRAQLEELLGIEGFSERDFDLRGFYKGARAL